VTLSAGYANCVNAMLLGPGVRVEVRAEEGGMALRLRQSADPGATV
jgi:hypothetical protein